MGMYQIIRIYTHSKIEKNALQPIDGFSNWFWIQLVLNQQKDK